MRLGGSTTMHAAVTGVGGLPGLAFGGGTYRCPGRNFAEAELALAASLLLLLFELELLPRDGEGPGGAAARRAAAADGAPAAGAASGAFPGDPQGLLPPPDLRKLVGIKVPAAPCWVQYRRRRSPA